MNAVEIEEAVSALVEEPFDATEFPCAFLQAFGNKETTLRKLRGGDTNKSDVGGVLQRNNIHLAVAPTGDVSEALAALRESPATAKHRVKFILATDGETVEAEELGSGEPLACAWSELPDHFGFFLPLAGITTVREIRENAFDIRATSKLNKLYLALLRDNPEWGTDERRPDMNHFMARLIFSFFAEDTGIFAESRLFTDTIARMSAADSSNTHEVIGTIFQAMNTKHADREGAGLPRWAMPFPYVNGGLFSGTMEVPRFSRTARSYLLQVGSLDWKQINPDIFGSMIQAVADDEERGALGMHYTSVPNILKVLNPLFLDDLRAKLEEAGDNPRTLLNLRKRIARIRVFDPACGSGNFLVIAYKEMRAIEHEINRRRGEAGRRTEIPLTNFRGIELRDFAAEIARLALIIAEFQCDELYRSQQDAIQDFLPLDAENWITRGNALQIDWLSICPPTGTQVKLVGDDLFSTPLDQPEIDFENVGGETYLCGNPPYQGSVNQTGEQKRDMASVFTPYLKAYKDLDYVAGWFVRAAEYAKHTGASLAFVATNSICQGEQVAMLWPILFKLGQQIAFAHTSFPWRNSAARNAGVTCVIIGLRAQGSGSAVLYDGERARLVTSIGPYLVPGSDSIVAKRQRPLADLPPMLSGNKATDGGNFVLDGADLYSLLSEAPHASRFTRRLVGSREFIRGMPRWCLWIDDADVEEAREVPMIAKRLDAVESMRRESRGKQANGAAERPHRFVYAPHTAGRSVLVPSVSSERRQYFPVALFDDRTVISNLALVLYDAPLWNVALIASKLHLVWIATVCGRMKTDYRYSNTLGWNTFPVPTLTEQNKADLTRCAEDILLAREAHYPATIADLYDPDTMPANLREAHERNDEVLERIYIGRRFRNDTERLEKLFEMYTKMNANEKRPGAGRRKRG
jgi:hypothetical protein